MPGPPVRRCCILLQILLLALLTSPSGAALAAKSPPAPPRAALPQQMRAMWVDSANPGFHTSAEVDELISNASLAHINTLFVQMRRHADSWYNLSMEPRAADPNLAPAASFDPLAYVIKKAHAAGINVHAWLVISVACRSYDTLWGDPAHVCTAHGPNSPDPLRWTTATYDGTQVGDLDFGHPAAVQYMEAVVETLARNYPALDGIHYDYIRYADSMYGYNAVSLVRFRSAYALPADYWPLPSNPLWSQWRRDRITELVRRLYIRIKAVNPRLQVSAATITWGGVGSYTPQDWPNSAAYSRTFQDWPAWLAEGILDFAVPMHYFDESETQTRGWYDSWLAWDRLNAGRRFIVAGLGSWMNTPQENVAQMQRALNPAAGGTPLAGISIYCYNEPIVNTNPQARRDYMAMLGSTIFASPAIAPQWPWMVHPTTGHLQGLATVDGQIVPNAHITILQNGAWVRDLTASVDGWYGTTDLPAGYYTIVIRNPQTNHTSTLTDLPVRAGMVMST